MTITGSFGASTTTDGSGNYAFQGLTAGGNYTITPSRTGYGFSAPQVFNNLSGNQTANFSAGAAIYTISGQVTVSGTSTGLGGVTITLSGSSSASTTTDNSGAYSIAGLALGGNYTVTPSRTGYTFTPTPPTFGNLSSNQTANFAATTSGYTISGKVTVGASSGFANVTVTLSGGSSATALTDGAGSYSFPGLAPGGSYTITPSRAAYTFTQPSSTFNGLSGNQQANFTGTPTATLSNLATNKTATQSSTYPGYPASNAVDGNTDGSVPHGSVTVTASGTEANPWWQVDLGTLAVVDSVVIWNRTDCCGYRLADYWVFVSDTPFSPTDTLATLQAHPGTMYMHMTTAPNPSTAIPFGNAARYIRLVSGATDYLSLAEVQVMVSSVSGSSGASSLGQVAVPAREHP
jgi:hypothetical protein